MARKLLALGYSEEEARGLPGDIASVIVESGIHRPEGPLPPEWLSEEGGTPVDGEGGYGEGEEEEYERPPPRPRRRAAGGRRGQDVPAAASSSPSPARRRRGGRSSGGSRRAAYRREEEDEEAEVDGVDDDPFLEEDEEGLDEEERAYRRGLQAPIYRPRPGFEDDDDDFGPTFTEQEPGLLPLLLDQVTAQIRANPVLRPLLREDRFKYLLSQEADLRCVRTCARAFCLPWLGMEWKASTSLSVSISSIKTNHTHNRLLVTGSWAADMLRDEYRWRLGLFRDYLKVEGKQPEGGRGGGGGGSRGRRRPPAQDEDEEEEDDDDFYFDRGDGQWHRTEVGEARRRERGRYWAGGENEEEGEDVVRRRGQGNRPEFDWEGGRGASGTAKARGPGPGRGGRRRERSAAMRGWDEEEEEEDGVLDASWMPYDEEESGRGGGGRRRSSSSSYRRPSHRRPEEEAEELVDRRFMGLEDEESTNDRSAAWIWYSPGSGGPVRGRGEEEDDEKEDEEDGGPAEAKHKEGKDRESKTTKKEGDKKAASSFGGFRWPWSRPKDEEEEDA